MAKQVKVTADTKRLLRNSLEEKQVKSRNYLLSITSTD